MSLLTVAMAMCNASTSEFSGSGTCLTSSSAKFSASSVTSRIGISSIRSRRYLSGLGIARAAFGVDGFRDVEIVLFSMIVPLITCELLIGSGDQITTRARRQGNVLNFWAAYHSLDLYQAALHLTTTFGVEIPMLDNSQQNRASRPPEA